MILFLAMLLLVLIGVAVAIFAVVAVMAGVLWLLWPLLLFVAVLIGIGYFIGYYRKQKGGDKKKEEPIDAEFKEESE